MATELPPTSPPARRIAAAVAATAVVASLLLAPPAEAAELDPLDAVAGAVAANDDPGLDPRREALPLDEPARAGALAVAEGELARVQFPSDAGEPIILTDAGGDEAIGIELPIADDVDADGTVRGDAAAYTGDALDVVATASDDGVRIATVLADADAPTDHVYRLDLPDGAELRPDGRGAIVVDTESRRAIATIAAPWALDARGRAVPTRYEIGGPTLTQIVDHRRGDVAYPVVADPTLKHFGWGVRIKFSKTETRNLSRQDGAAGAAAFCRAISATVPGIVCAALTAVTVARWLGTFKTAAAKGKCAELHYVWGTGPALWSSHVSSSCRG